ncbi:hypothetical protein FRC12_003629 [Ceratobasidium sp. 428]|nr:hypothetical protein FRC12_003629 [Ceratobasidium sp. 428]
MLKRFKLTSDRAEKAIRRIFRSQTPEPPKLELIYTEWEGLNALVASLNKDPGLFEPLASIFGQLLAYVEKYDIRLRTRPEYAQLGVDLDDLCLHMTKYINPEQPLSVSFESIANLAHGLDYEVKILPNSEEGGNLDELEEAATAMNAHIALRVFSRIRKLLALFVMSENTNLWKMGVDEIEAIGLVVPSHAPEAHYRYAGPGAVPRNGCMQSTRVTILRDLQEWVYYGRSQNILWLNGTAGTGKTTIMYSLCEYLEGSGRLSANFFSSRRHPSCRDARKIVPSISYQLARQSRPYRCALSRVLSQDPEVVQRSIDEQIERMILVPLQTVAHTFNADPVILIDGLDQCDDVYAAKCALGAILRHASNLPVRMLVASRPSPGIQGRIRRSQTKHHLPLELRLHEQDQTVVQGDIKAYLAVELKHLALTPDDLEQLLGCVGVLFFYAAIVVDYLSDSEEALSGTERLNDLLHMASLNDGIQRKEAAYAYMLDKLLGADRSVTAESDQIKLVIGTLVSVQESLSVNAITELLRLDLVDVVGNLLYWFLPVLRVSPTDKRAIYLDKSFTEYLSSSHRVSEFLPDEGGRNKQISHACFNVIKSVDPPFNICNLESSYLEDREVSDLSERVKEAIPPELLYACRRWAGHMTLVGRSDDIVGDLEAFLSARLLLWMEVLNLNRCTSGGVEILSSAQVWAQSEMLSDSLKDLMEDARQFVESFSSRVISSSTPHIYLSQLQFWPQHRRVSQCYHYRFDCPVSQTHKESHTCRVGAFCYSPDCTCVGSGASDDNILIWDARASEPADQSLTRHKYSIFSVAYSPDGTYIASGSKDKTVRIWDARTGKSVGQPLTGHTGSVNSVAYSPDGAYIASGSVDQTIRVWDTHTGKPLGQPFTGHTDWVYPVTYSPDGAYIASGSDDSTIRIWDARTGEPVGQPLTGHTEGVYSVAYSPNGAYITSGSSDKTIRIWDARTGKPIAQPPTDPTYPVLSVVYSPDGAYITSASDDKTIRIWDARTGKPTRKPLTGRTEGIYSVAYSPDGEYIASGCSDNTIRIWDARTGEPLGQPLTGHTDLIRSVTYSPDGAYIASGSVDATIRVWFAPTRPDLTPVQLSAPSQRTAIDAFRRPFWTVYKSANRTSRSSRSDHTPKANRRMKNQAASIPPITASPHDWMLNDDGWVVGPSQKRLVWVPPDLQDKVAPPRTKAIISTEPSIVLDFREAELGLDWQDCYKPS